MPHYTLNKGIREEDQFDDGGLASFDRYLKSIEDESRKYDKTVTEPWESKTSIPWAGYKTFQIKTYIPDGLYQGSRPNYPKENIYSFDIKKFIQSLKDKGIKSILCLLSREELIDMYRFDLLAFYEKSGFHVEHIHIEDYKQPAASRREKLICLQKYETMPKPVYIHCSAGIDRSNAIALYITHNSTQPTTPDEEWN